MYISSICLLISPPCDPLPRSQDTLQHGTMPPTHPPRCSQRYAHSARIHTPSTTPCPPPHPRHLNLRLWQAGAWMHPARCGRCPEFPTRCPSPRLSMPLSSSNKIAIRAVRVRAVRRRRTDQQPREVGKLLQHRDQSSSAPSLTHTHTYPRIPTHTHAYPHIPTHTLLFSPSTGTSHISTSHPPPLALLLSPSTSYPLPLTLHSTSLPPPLYLFTSHHPPLTSPPLTLHLSPSIYSCFQREQRGSSSGKPGLGCAFGSRHRCRHRHRPIILPSHRVLP